VQNCGAKLIRDIQSSRAAWGNNFLDSTDQKISFFFLALGSFVLSKIVKTGLILTAAVTVDEL